MRTIHQHLIRFALYGVLLCMLCSGCAQIGAPTGGPKDTLAPVLIKATPEPRSLQFNGNKLVFSFDEFVELQDIQNNLLVSPFQKNNPSVNYNLRTVTLRFKDTLLPNTTYVVNFGNAIKDINEGNVVRNFSYVFSTGDFLDSLTLNGKVYLAENGKTDSTLLVLLYRNAPDSAVKTRKPDYVTRLNGKGEFRFTNLPADQFSIYALKDGDGNKFYNAKTEIFAFHDLQVSSGFANVINLYAYAEAKPAPVNTSTKKESEKKLRYSPAFINGKQDLRSPLELNFNNPLKDIMADSIILCDTNYVPLKGYIITADSTRRKLQIAYNWEPDYNLNLILFKNVFTDSSGQGLTKTDTIRFSTKNKSDYGSLRLRFKNLSLDKHPLLQFMDGDQVRWKFEVNASEWFNKMILPGEYEVRILYDENNNGIWDAGDYDHKIQPEKAITLPQKISIKSDWENERDIEL